MKLKTILASAMLCFAGSASLAHASGGDGGYAEDPFMPQWQVMQGDVARYAAGELGVVPASYWRIYLVLAYRAASGMPLSAQEMALIQISGWRVSAANPGTAPSADIEAAAWLAARRAFVASQPPGTSPNKYARFTEFTNCKADAYRRATDTLAARQAAHGLDAAKRWLAQQDAVFAACSSAAAPDAELPALAADAPLWLRQDHAYQSAALAFYQGRFEVAQARFEALSKDKSSVWQPLGEYLAARALLRRAAFEGLGEEPRSAAAERTSAGYRAEARRRLAALAADPKDAGMQSAAQSLLGWVDAQLRPTARLAELGARFNAGKLDAQGVLALTDTLAIWDALGRVEPEDAATAQAPLLASPDPMTAWIGVMKSYELRLPAPANARGLAAVRARKNFIASPLWLMALLHLANDKDLRPEELKAAAAVPATHPAYVHLQYHLARLKHAGGDASAAYDISSALAKRATHSVATRNRIQQIRMQSAPTREAFFAAAKRSYAANEQRVPIPDEATQLGAAEMDASFAPYFYQHASIEEQLLARAYLPNADTVWARAVLQERFDVAQAFTGEVRRLRKSTARLYTRLDEAQTKQDKGDAALLILVHSPELVPVVLPERYGWGGDWCVRQRTEGVDPKTVAIPPPPPAYLSAQSLATARREHAALMRISNRSDTLGPPLLAYAQRKPQDEELPEALALFVASTRMECQGAPRKPGTQSYSQQAFELLKRKYPSSAAAKRTKYHF